ncbi:ABC transporter ATP-binding protein [Streptomyces paromomycinus]|uniref:ABC transporter ATP-binding protein n=1 Tax=Streptomyces paromomycinus TaxID=92743 RepID=UPI000F625684|nr:ABC transporter ATP-binding protein [Streptomyces paromomycinus]
MTPLIAANCSTDAVPPLDIRSLCYRTSERTVLKNLQLRLEQGESVAIMGPSGSGKSTLLSIALGLLTPTSGTVSVAGIDVHRLKKKARAAHRATNIGMVFQFGELFPELSPVENVELAALLARSSPKAARARAEKILAELGVPDAECTDELSGGERQRTAVARALINTPKLILADEPTGALDTKTRDHLADLLFSMPRQHDCSLLVVSHDYDVAKRADRVFKLQDAALYPLDIESAIHQ